jgi:hypothetical protein
MTSPAEWSKVVVDRFLPECPVTGELRVDCPCPSCAEHRECLREKNREEAEDREWERREISRMHDKEYARRRM